MIYVLSLDSENVIHEIKVDSWKSAMMNLEYWENTFTLKQVFLSEHKDLRDKKKMEWAKWLSE